MLSKTQISDKHAQNWEKRRSKGIWRYILVHGVLFWGLSVGIGSLLFLTLTKRNGEYIATESLSSTIIYIAGFCLAGLLYGYLQWRAQEKAYQRYLVQKEGE